MRRVLILALPVLMFLGTGCVSDGGGSGFSQKVGAVSPAGTTKVAVQRALGKPDAKRIEVAGATADNAAPATVRTGMRYERWTYNRDGKRHDVYLGPSLDGRGTWEVQEVRTSAAPTTPVAGAW